MAEEDREAQAGGAPFWKRRSFWLGGSALTGLAALGAVAPGVWASHGMPAHGFGGHGRFAFGGQILNDPEAAKRHAALAVEWVLRGVQATDEQKQQARRIAEQLVDELGPLAAKHHEHHAALVRELARPELDRAAIERLRQEEIALADDASRLALGRIAELAEVLTPAQRQDLVSFAHRF